MDSPIGHGQFGPAFAFVGQLVMLGQLKYTPSWPSDMKIARVYLRVSTDEQDLTRQADIERTARQAGY